MRRRRSSSSSSTCQRAATAEGCLEGYLVESTSAFAPLMPAMLTGSTAVRQTRTVPAEVLRRQHRECGVGRRLKKPAHRRRREHVKGEAARPQRTQHTPTLRLHRCPPRPARQRMHKAASSSGRHAAQQAGAIGGQAHHCPSAASMRLRQRRCWVHGCATQGLAHRGEQRSRQCSKA